MSGRAYVKLSECAPVMARLALAWFLAHPGTAWPCKVNGVSTVVLDDRKAAGGRP